ncbi:MAG: hypothetical protein LBH41_02055, partial [Rickettsiales bacterium]|nr:hypothetical protein [Rickettsiales bacterium]
SGSGSGSGAGGSDGGSGDTSGGGAGSGGASGGGSGKESGAKVSINSVKIADASVSYANHGTGTAASFFITDARLDLDGGTANASARMTFDGNPLFIDLAARPLEGSPNDALVNASAFFGGATIQATGKITNFMEPRMFSAVIKASSDDLSLFPGMPKLFSKPASLEAEIVGAGGIVEIASFDAKYDSASISGSAAADLSGKPRISLSATMPFLDIPNIFYPGWEEAYRQRVLSGQEPPDDGEETPPGAKAFRGAPLPFGEMGLFDADLDISIGELKAMPDMRATNLALKASLHDGEAAIAPLSFDYMGGKASIFAIADNRHDRLNGQAALRADDISIGRIIDSTGYEGVFEDGPANADLALSGHGADLAEFMAGLNGYIKAWTKGRMTGYRIERLFAAQDPIIQTLRSAMRTARKEESRIQCAVANLPIRGGVAHSFRGIAIQTDDSNIIADGSVDFAQEKMDVQMITIDKGTNIIGTITDMIKIQGSIAEPQIALNTEKVAEKAVSTGVIAAGIGLATGGVGLIAAGIGLAGSNWITAMESDPNPCMTAFEGAAPGSSKEEFAGQPFLRADLEQRARERLAANSKAVRDAIGLAKKSIK